MSCVLTDSLSVQTLYLHPVRGEGRMDFDYIIVGAGSAGCVLANRLSADRNNKVCLIEAGGSDKNPIISTPAGIIFGITTKLYNWYYYSSPQPTQYNRSIFCPRGKVLGGSSSINAMLYVRGQPQDYDHWASLGNKGWDFASVLPYFKKSQYQERGADHYHGNNGSLNVADVRHRHPLSERFIQAAQQVGISRNDDFNGARQQGVGYYQVTQKNGRRCSSAAAFLHPIIARKNLTVITQGQVQKILFNNKEAVGVELLQSGQIKTLYANKEVILSAGAFGSPQLLLMSGIGAREKLDVHGIDVQHELPGVGENLQEHVDVLTVVKDKSRSAISFRPGALLRQASSVYQYLKSGRGLLSSPLAEAGGFIQSDSSVDSPDIQFHFVPSAMDDHGRSRQYYLEYGYSLHVCLLRPKSRGSLSLAGASPSLDPIINLNMLSHPQDMAALIEGVRRGREILRAPAMADCRGEEIFPGDDISERAALEEFIRRKANTIYHPVGTCKMGSDPMAVVDDQLRVHGIKRLRVVDASIMPTIVSGNTNAPSMMIAEKAADMILQPDSVTTETDCAIQVQQ